MDLPIDSFWQIPNCNYPTVITAELATGEPLPAWIIVDLDDNKLKVESDDINLVGQIFTI